MITAALVAGLAGFWVWTVLNDRDGLFGFVTRAAERTKWTKKWLECPWCSGAWFAIAASLTICHSSVGVAVVTALGASGVTGLLGSYIAGE